MPAFVTGATGLYDQALTANTVTTVTFTDLTDVSGQVTVWNLGSVEIFARPGTVAYVSDAFATLIPAGTQVDVDLGAAAAISLISTGSPTFHITRSSTLDPNLIVPGAGGTGGGSTDVSALAKDATFTTGVAHTDSAAILAKLPTSPALDASVQAVHTDLTTGVAHTDSAAILAKLTSDPATGTKQGTLVAQDSSFQQTTANGSLGAANATLAVTVGRRSTLTAHVTGTFVGTITLQAQLDGATWTNITSPAQWINATTGAYQTAITTAGIYQTSVTGFTGARLVMSSYTSGTAVVYVACSDEPATVALDQPLPAGSAVIGAVSISGTPSVALSGTTTKAASTAAVATDTALVVALSPNTPLYIGSTPVTSISAAAAVTTGSQLNNVTARKSHTLQVDISTTVAGTGGSHTVILEGSLDGTYFTTLGTVTPASTVTGTTDASNHANVSAANLPYQYIRARWTTIPTGWTGTLTARVASGN